MRTEVLAALTIIGLDHLDELGAATLSWSRQSVDLPAEYDSITVPAGAELSDTSILIRLPELHHNAVEEHLGGPALRSALAWVGLHHVDELPAVFAEIDDLQRRLPAGHTLGDFYVDTIAALGGDTPPSPGEALRAIRRLRAGDPVAKVAKATGLPRKLLTALSVEAVSAIDGGLPLTG